MEEQTRKPLRAQLNQIRSWVRQGRTDAWVAHRLGVSTGELSEFKRQNQLDQLDAERQSPAPPSLTEELKSVVEQSDADEVEQSDSESRDRQTAPEKPESTPARRRRRGGRRGGRSRLPKGTYEGTLDHGEQEGYGVWLDPAVVDDPTYREHWAGVAEVTVRLEPDAIVITARPTKDK